MTVRDLNGLPDRLEPVSMHVTMEKIRLYADIVDDYNPIHVDPEFAASTPLKGIIAHGTMSLALVWQTLRASFPADVIERTHLEIRFVKPVRIDDRLTTVGERDAEGWLVSVVNQENVAVIEGHASIV